MTKYILIPGRHHLVTSYQISYLREQLNLLEPGAQIIWAITSANHSGTRRNPISGARRQSMIDLVVAHEKLPSLVFQITNMTQKQDFEHYLIEDIRVQTDGEVDLSPDNCLIACSTPEIISAYRNLGFDVVTVELDEATGRQTTDRPWDVVERLCQLDDEWKDDEYVRHNMHEVCIEYYDKYNLTGRLQETFSDPLFDSDDGDITATRDYVVYRAAFEDGAKRKVPDFIESVRPGKIIDIGCATGETIKILTEKPELFESDFYGVEAARPLYDMCEQRKANGEFGNSSVYFYQRNIMTTSLIKNNSANTIITMALTHEIESYLGRGALIDFLKRTYDMLAPGGVYINYDVVGPGRREEKVYFQPNKSDGDNPEDLRWGLHGVELADFMRRLSTAARFKRFIRDFRSVEGGIDQPAEVIHKGELYYQLSRGDLAEFLAKKDYLASWESEMHEKFCFFDHDEWAELLTEIGFKLTPATRAITNHWLIQNRFEPSGYIAYSLGEESMPLADFVTNTLLIAEKEL